MKRFLMLAVLLTALVACSSDPPSAPMSPVAEQVAAPADSPQAQVEPAVGGEKRRVKWPLVPGWDSVYGPEGYAEACFKKTRRDAIFLQRAVDRFVEDGFHMADGFPVYPDHPYADTNEAGRSVMDYMPHGGRVSNHYIGVEYGINWGCQAGRLGEICYISIMDHLGYNVGYRITAMGLYREEYFEFTYVDSSLIGGP